MHGFNRLESFNLVSTDTDFSRFANRSNLTERGALIETGISNGV